MPHKNTENVLRCALVSPGSVFVKRSHDSSSCERSYWMEVHTRFFLQFHQCCHAVTVPMGFEKTNWNLLAIIPNPLQYFKGIMQVTCHYFWQALDEVALEEELEEDSEDNEMEVRIGKYKLQGNRLIWHRMSERPKVTRVMKRTQT